MHPTRMVEAAEMASVQAQGLTAMGNYNLFQRQMALVLLMNVEIMW